MSDRGALRPCHVRQDLETQVQLLPSGTTIWHVATFLTDRRLHAHKLRRLRDDLVEESPLDGRVLSISLTAEDVPISFGDPWTGYARLSMEYSEDQVAPRVSIRVGGYSGINAEVETAADARVMWRIGQLLEDAYHEGAAS